MFAKFPLYEMELLSSVPNEIQIDFSFHSIQIILGLLKRYPKIALKQPFREFFAPQKNRDYIFVRIYIYK